ncbi:uncharacterized protein LY89DRAFT_163523 [Mollisia scopiformis]|uniref:Uncharacterized protein n=1 Tax=Mollisia scopiformis TaxID=149040 RepID=A0A194XSH3_MOLSC|nr:uncharacterized protein LY89DRAFT_163523 [Mollisia scopiformis]KUJ22989.1 hypothetical protein LY89DRAFT_163523 [Mollisia scopiformis]
MPSEHLQSQSHSQMRPALAVGHRSNSSVNNETDSPAGTPPQHGRTKSAKHVVGAGRTHARVPSSKGLHKLTKGHAAEGSHTDLKKLGKQHQSSSSTNLKKNSSHVSLKRNRSSADVQKRPRSAHGHDKRPASVHFEIGDQEDAWEEASNPSSASPALSRSASRSAVSSGQSSTKPSASNSRPQSPPHSPLPPPASSSKTVVTPAANANGGNEKQTSRHSADAKVITERLLQRTHSHHNTTKMSLTTATPDGHSPESLTKSQSSTLNGTPQTSSNNEVVSRFVGGSGTPSENSPFLHNRHKSDVSPKANVEEVKRAQSMGNLTRRDSDEESALAPRSRKSSQSSNYYPPQQSRTQQKLWLQRASSNMEPAQMAPGVALNGLSGMHGGFGGTSLVGGAGYDGRDPRIKLQLEKTGLEYLVVRRYQDPVGKSLKRLAQLPGAEKNRRIPPQRTESSGASRYGLSQSLQSRGRGGKDKSSPANGVGSYDGQAGSHEDAGISDRGNEDDGVGAILQSMWQKSFDLSASAD